MRLAIGLVAIGAVVYFSVKLAQAFGRGVASGIANAKPVGAS